MSLFSKIVLVMGLNINGIVTEIELLCIALRLRSSSPNQIHEFLLPFDPMAIFMGSRLRSIHIKYYVSSKILCILMNCLGITQPHHT